MKILIKKIIPQKTIDLFRSLGFNKYINNRHKKYLKEYDKFYEGDLVRSQKHTNSYIVNDTPQKLIGLIITVYHTIEKGLTMGNTSFGFGYKQMNYLLDLCELYMNKYGTDNEMLIEAIGVISEYVLFHKRHSYNLDLSLQQKIDNLIRISHLDYITEQIGYTKNEYFKNAKSSFDLFSKSRRSLRDFNKQKSINIELIEKAIELAQNAPSTCNRQSVRLHLITNKELLIEILSLQNGNRGFGERADKLIIITSDLQCWGWPNERFGPFLDSGIYTMNLLYALHFYEIGAITLNWYSSIENDLKLRSLINIPENEVVSVIIACGELNDSFKIAKSKRVHYRSIVRYHN